MDDKFPFDDLGTYKESFDYFDQDGDGSISTTEFQHVLNSLGQFPTPEQLNDQFSEVDENHDGKIDYAEFVKRLKVLEKEFDEDEEFRETFNTFDKDGDGYISRNELKQIMASIGAEVTDSEIDAMIQTADKDGDGQVNFEEFVSMVKEK